MVMLMMLGYRWIDEDKDKKTVENKNTAILLCKTKEKHLAIGRWK